MDEQILELCDSIRSMLDSHHHVHYQGAEVDALCSALLSRDPSARVRLGEGFRKTIVLDGSNGVDSGGRFRMERFLRSAVTDIGRAFEVSFPSDVFHPEQIAQVLKDEEASLFCFVGIEHLTDDDFQQLRGLGFTQGKHYVVLCGQSDFISAKSLPSPANLGAKREARAASPFESGSDRLPPLRARGRRTLLSRIVHRLSAWRRRLTAGEGTAGEEPTDDEPSRSGAAPFEMETKEYSLPRKFD